MYDLLVVGAGPYGLSIAAHAAAAGLSVRVLGRPMASWRDHMPAGMLLKSEPWSSNLSDPAGDHTLSGYCAARNLPAAHGSPVDVGTFTGYGMWFAEQAVPRVEDRTVTALRPWDDGFRADTAQGECTEARAVALAVGVLPFANRPRPLADLPPELVTHSSDHHDLSRFRGRDVTVIGAGQAALETAALLAENGATTRIVARADGIRWNTVPQPLHRGLLRSLRDPHCGLGTGWSSWVFSELPWAVRRLPGSTRTRIAATALGPAGAWWLRDRFEDAVPALLGRRLTAATPAGCGGVRLELADEAGARTVLETEHVIAATGFTPDLARIRLLDPVIRAGLRTVSGGRTPELDAHFASSWPGLYFAGLMAAPAFGPAMRFVHGAAFTADRLVRGVRRHAGAERPGARERARAGVREGARAGVRTGIRMSARRSVSSSAVPGRNPACPPAATGHGPSAARSGPPGSEGC